MTEDFEAFVSRLRDFQSRTWAGHVLPIESDALAATFEKLELEKWYAEDVHCKADHDQVGRGPCSVEVTHLVNSCNRHDVPVCKAFAENRRVFILGGGVCAGCRGYAADCWTVRPI